MTKRIQIGVITTSHGIKGLVKIRPLVEDERLLEGEVFTSETEDKTISVTLKSPMKNIWLANIEGIADKTGADALRGTKLYLDRSALPAPDEDEFYYSDLIGLPVESPEGDTIGEIIAVENFGASDLLDIKPAEGGSSFYLPLTDDIVPEILKDKIIALIPEGLRE